MIGAAVPRRTALRAALALPFCGLAEACPPRPRRVTPGDLRDAGPIEIAFHPETACIRTSTGEILVETTRTVLRGGISVHESSDSRLFAAGDLEGALRDVIGRGAHQVRFSEAGRPGHRIPGSHPDLLSGQALRLGLDGMPPSPLDPVLPRPACLPAATGRLPEAPLHVLLRSEDPSSPVDGGLHGISLPPPRPVALSGGEAADEGRAAGERTFGEGPMPEDRGGQAEPTAFVAGMALLAQEP